MSPPRTVNIDSYAACIQHRNAGCLSVSGNLAHDCDGTLQFRFDRGKESRRTSEQKFIVLSAGQCKPHLFHCGQAVVVNVRQLCRADDSRHLAASTDMVEVAKKPVADVYCAADPELSEDMRIRAA